jgi:hypothetical protein
MCGMTVLSGAEMVEGSARAGAFAAGRTLLDAGAVSELASVDGGASGRVADGDATHDVWAGFRGEFLVGECDCADSEPAATSDDYLQAAADDEVASPKLCAHAVAVALAAIEDRLPLATAPADHRPRSVRVPGLGPVGALAVARRWRTYLSPDDRAALGMWAGAHLALFALAWPAAWVYRSTTDHAPLTGVFQHWDANFLQNIAQYGYFSAHSMKNSVAFFPGYSIVLAAAHLILRNWVLSELVVSGVAGCFAVVSLSRLAGGRRAVLYLLTMPVAIFLMVGYAECLFLAFAIPAWHAATRGRWWRAALLAGLAGLVRPDGVFLLPALFVMALTGPRGRRLANAAKSCCAAAGPGAYEIYLKVHTGSWVAFTKAQAVGWQNHVVTPIQALKTTYWAAFQHPFSAADAFEFQLELVAMAAMVLATIAFLWRNRWPEAVYCGLAMLTIGTDTWYEVGTRTVLMLFPIWIALARLDARRPWLRYIYLSVSAPLAAIVGLLFLSNQWAG